MAYHQAIAIDSTKFPVVALIYEVDDNGDYVVAAVGSAWVDSKYYVGNKKPRKYKLYHSPKKDSFYFRYNRDRFYLVDAMRVNTGIMSK